MKAALFGGTGFVGSHIVDSLVAAGHTPRCLVRRGSENKLRHPERCEQVSGDIDDADAVARTIEGADAVIYLVGLLRESRQRGDTWEAAHFEGPVRAMEAAKRSGAGRFVYMSSNGAGPSGTRYQTTKYRAEQHLQGSGLPWTVFRPSVIFGDPRGRMELATQLKRQMIDPPLPAPLFHRGLSPAGAGRFRLTPVAVEDVATCFVRSLEAPEAAGRLYFLGGPDALEWRRLVAILAEACGKPRKLMLPAPVPIVGGVAALLDRFPWFPVTHDQLEMLVDGNECDGSEAFRQFGVQPKHFTPQTLRYLTRA